MPEPTTLLANAWIGRTASADLGPHVLPWALRGRPARPVQYLRPDDPADPADWTHPSVGWGLILPEPAGDHGISPADLAGVDDQPEPIRRLYAARAAQMQGDSPPPVFRYKPDRADRFTTLQNHATGRSVTIGGGRQGVGPGALPAYLLIYGAPAEIPWQLQYVLNTHCAVGRLDLAEDEGLGNYIDALIRPGWNGSAMDIDRTVVWAVDLGDDDITALMATAIAGRIARDYSRDAELNAKLRYFDGRRARSRCDLLYEALNDRLVRSSPPAVIITTSHGQTDPALPPDALQASLGSPVDHFGETLDAGRLMSGGWHPDGAIWYSHACCSAGSNDLSAFAGLVSEHSGIDSVLKTVSDYARQFGARSAPFARRLLGAERPLRAFVGHVEPTFDWTLRNPNSGQYLTDNLCQAMYEELYRGQPVGLAFRRWYARVGVLGTQYDAARADFDRGGNPIADLLFYQLAERDVKSLVILGDPTVRLPL